MLSIHLIFHYSTRCRDMDTDRRQSVIFEQTNECSFVHIIFHLLKNKLLISFYGSDCKWKLYKTADNPFHLLLMHIEKSTVRKKSIMLKEKDVAVTWYALITFLHEKFPCHFRLISRGNYRNSISFFFMSTIIYGWLKIMGMS